MVRGEPTVVVKPESLYSCTEYDWPAGALLEAVHPTVSEAADVEPPAVIVTEVGAANCTVAMAETDADTGDVPGAVVQDVVFVALRPATEML